MYVYSIVAIPTMVIFLCAPQFSEDSARRIPDISTCISKLQDILDNPDKYLRLGILICGQTGVGKATLVNSLFGCNLLPIGYPGYPSVMEKVESNINGTIVTIWNCPGLHDGTVDNMRYLQKMYDNCRDVDLVLYCVDMTIVRRTDQEIKAVKLLTAKFGKYFWEKSVLVLTKANTVHIPRGDRKNKRAYHERLYCIFIHQLRETLSEQEVPERVYSSLPAVAAGMVEGNIDEDDEESYKERYLMYVSEQRKDRGTREDFITELWVTVFEVLKRDPYAQAQLVNVTDPSRLTITEDAKKSNPETAKQISQHRETMSQIRMATTNTKEDDDTCTTEETLQHTEELAIAQVEHDAEQPEQNENDRDITEKIKKVQQLFEGIPIPDKMEGADNMLVDSEHIARVADNTSTIAGVVAGCVAGGATYGAIGGPFGVLIGGAIGAVVGVVAKRNWLGYFSFLKK